MKGLFSFLFNIWVAPRLATYALSVGQRVQTAGGRVGVAVFDNSAVTTNARPGVIVLYVDNTYTEEVSGTLVNVAGGWIPGIGPGQ